ncbi:MAG: FHA domain-containing protein [Myxococcota bacterium]
MREAELILRRKGEPDEIFQIQAEETLIGRAPTNDLRFRDESMSREHAVILWEDGSYTIEDLQSTNGIRVNGKKLRSSALEDGDEISIGQTQITFVLK